MPRGVRFPRALWEQIRQAYNERDAEGRPVWETRPLAAKFGVNAESLRIHAQGPGWIPRERGPRHRLSPSDRARRRGRAVQAMQTVAARRGDGRAAAREVCLELGLKGGKAPSAVLASWIFPTRGRVVREVWASLRAEAGVLPAEAGFLQGAGPGRSVVEGNRRAVARLLVGRSRSQGKTFDVAQTLAAARAAGIEVLEPSAEVRDPVVPGVGFICERSAGSRQLELERLAAERTAAAVIIRAGPRPPAGHIRFICGHVIDYHFGPGRFSYEECRDCLKSKGEMGSVEISPGGMVIIRPPAVEPKKPGFHPERLRNAAQRARDSEDELAAALGRAEA